MAAKAGEFARALSIPEGLFDLLRRGTEETTKSARRGAPRSASSRSRRPEQAERLAKAWENTSQSVSRPGGRCSTSSPDRDQDPGRADQAPGRQQLAIRDSAARADAGRAGVAAEGIAAPRRRSRRRSSRRRSASRSSCARAAGKPRSRPAGPARCPGRRPRPTSGRPPRAVGSTQSRPCQVARSEGLNAYQGDHDATGRATSFGPFQLHYAGTGKHTSPGLGEEFTKRTGLDARDPVTVRQQIDFALDEARKGGWGPWHGWRGDAWAGIDRSARPGKRRPDRGATFGRPTPGGRARAIRCTANRTGRRALVASAGPAGPASRRPIGGDGRGVERQSDDDDDHDDRDQGREPERPDAGPAGRRRADRRGRPGGAAGRSTIAVQANSGPQ
jgi:hypothetical protein